MNTNALGHLTQFFGLNHTDYKHEVAQAGIAGAGAFVLIKFGEQYAGKTGAAAISLALYAIAELTQRNVDSVSTKQYAQAIKLAAAFAAVYTVAGNATASYKANGVNISGIPSAIKGAEWGTHLSNITTMFAGYQTLTSLPTSCKKAAKACKGEGTRQNRGLNGSPGGDHTL
ncbi:hypothetical protein SCG7109_BB_00090 [Chlamydiales bacterium SCGC AG-110-M15]|nr:hypothetical protein SCG7109_BB_00090 [Chlamydiales bacterium SCGC AG-110-M15]